MPDVSFSGLVIVSAVGFAAPFLLGLFPRLRFPAVVVEIVLGIVLGPSVLGWVHPDLVIRVLSVVGLGCLLFLAGLGRSMRISSELMQLADTTAQIRVRGAVLVLMAFLALAARFGLETILGAFLAGVMLGAVDRDATMNHPHFRLKLEGIAFGFVVPIFFVASGIEFDAKAVFGRPSTLVLVPIFLAALLIVRGVPALLYRPLVGDRKTAAAALL